MAYWIWFPHDFEIDLRGKVEMRRQEHGMTCPSIWRMDAPGRSIAFHKRYHLDKPGRTRMASQGGAYVMLDGAAAKDKSEWIDLPAGDHFLNIQVMNLNGLPALYLEGDLSTDDTFLACENNADEVPCGWSPLFDTWKKRPENYALPTRRLEAASVAADGLVDFGREVFGFAHLKAAAPGEAVVFYGESVQEARAGFTGEIWDRVTFERAGQEVRLPSRAMRYLRADGPVEMSSVWLEEEINGLTMRASFASSDERLNRIYDVSARTMELCTREFFLDGIKRDRWVWAGDALQSVMMNNYSYFDSETARRTLAALRGREPFDAHINTILDYTFYWMIAVWEDYFYTGDDRFLKGMYGKMVSAMEYTKKQCSADGFVVGKPKDWVFVDWTDMSKEGELCVEQVLLWKGLTVLADSARLLGKAADEARWQAEADKLRAAIFDVFWDEEKGTLLHQRVNGKVQGHTRYAPMFAVMYGLLRGEQARSAIEHSLLHGDAPEITTPYMRFYEMDALMRAGCAEQVLRDVRDYWGGMLDLGATSIWEQFNPNEQGDEHWAMYGRPFGRSLCHCWGAGPIYLCGRYLLGVHPLEAGYARYEIAPQAAGLESVKGEVPVPGGSIRVEMENGGVRVVSACKGRGVLRWKEREIEIPAADGGPVEVLVK